MTKYRDFEVFGTVREFVNYRGSEAIIHGPAETGKTIGALYKLHVCASTYPNASIVIARKTLASTYATVLQTYLNKVLMDDPYLFRIRPYGGEKPEWFDYPNGARIWITGLDKSSKVLSSEHDIVYVNQAEELDLDDWETLTTRTTGRAGNMPYSQTIGDANPAWPTHWLYHRDGLRLFYSVHTDNPILYNSDGTLTEQGERTMGVLGRLTGVRRVRLLEGKPAQAEGVIYTDWDDATHLLYADKVPTCMRHVAGVDWGYKHPGVLGVWGQEGRDGKLYLKTQFYHALRNIDWWIERGKEVNDEFGIETFACDPSRPEYIAQFKAAGLNAIAAFNGVQAGIDAVQRRLADNALFVVRDSLRRVDENLKESHQPYATQHEFASYVWANSKNKEQPVKEQDDGMDAMRYAVCYFDGITKEEPKKEVKSWRPY